MSLCHQTYQTMRDCSRLVIAVVLHCTRPAVAERASLKTPPKVDVFVGYQWLTPEATSRTERRRARCVQDCPSLAQGFGTSHAYNFTK